MYPFVSFIAVYILTIKRVHVYVYLFIIQIRVHIYTPTHRLYFLIVSLSSFVGNSVTISVQMEYSSPKTSLKSTPLLLHNVGAYATMNLYMLRAMDSDSTVYSLFDRIFCSILLVRKYALRNGRISSLVMRLSSGSRQTSTDGSFSMSCNGIASIFLR